MFDFTPITTSSLILAAVCFAVSHFGLELIVKKKWLRPVTSRPAVVYGGAVVIAVTTIAASLVLRDDSRLLVGLVIAGLVILLAGSRDEHTPISPGKQLLLQTLAAAFAVAGGWTIQFISQPAGEGIIMFNPLVGALLAIAWLLLLMNAVNWLDGVDGLASSVGGIALVTLAALSLLPSVQDPVTFTLGLLGAATMGGFLLWNFPPARAFLGTSGSWWLGLYIGLVAINGGGKIVTTLLVLAFPVVDVLLVCLQRVKAGQPPWQGDTVRHLHHRLLKRGFSHRTITLVASVVTAILGTCALILQTQQKIIALAMASALIIIAGLALAVTRAHPQRKKSRLTRIIFIACIALVLGIILFAQKPCRNFNEGTATVGDTEWSVAIADTPLEHNRGLMECPAIPHESGMYFVFDQPSTQPFWMKNMLTPLDIIWIREGEIIGIERNVPVAGDNPNPPRYFAPQPYTAVLELPAGEAQLYGLEITDEVLLEVK